MFNKMIAGVLPYMPKSLVWLFSKQYIAGQNLEEAIQNCLDLNKQGMLTTIDVLGEFITTLDEADANKKEYLQVIERAEQAGVKGNYSLKPTFFGLLLDKEKAYQHIREVVARAAEYNNFVRIDMEDSPCTDDTIDIYKRIREEFPANVGVVLQAYLKRTADDINTLAQISTAENPVNFRLCKGIYVEPAEIAYRDKQEVRKKFLEDLHLMLQHKLYPAIATHDKVLIDGAYELIKRHGVSKEQYEFQMLYGVTPALRQSIVNDGHTMRIYVPFGKHWFGYSTRRLKENPAMAGVIVKALFKRG